MPPEDIALQAYLASIVESSDDAIIGKTLDGIVMSWNKAAERFRLHGRGDDRPPHVATRRAGSARRHDMDSRPGPNGERIDHYETVKVPRTAA